MEVILTQEVGDVVKVKDGYARNFLLPQNRAYLATPANVKRMAKQAEKRQEQYEQEKKAARELAEKLNTVSCTVSVEVNDQEKLYGSVTETDIVKALEVEGHTIDRKDIEIPAPIQELGIFEVNILLHPEVTAKIKLWVTKK